MLKKLIMALPLALAMCTTQPAYSGPLQEKRVDEVFCFSIASSEALQELARVSPKQTFGKRQVRQMIGSHALMMITLTATNPGVTTKDVLAGALTEWHSKTGGSLTEQKVRGILRAYDKCLRMY